MQSKFRPCAFAQIDGAIVRIIDLDRTIVNDDKAIRDSVTKQMGWEENGVAILLYLDEYRNNFTEGKPQKIHCFMQPDNVPEFFKHAKSGIEFVECEQF